MPFQTGLPVACGVECGSQAATLAVFTIRYGSWRLPCGSQGRRVRGARPLGVESASHPLTYLSALGVYASGSLPTVFRTPESDRDSGNHPDLQTPPPAGRVGMGACRRSLPDTVLAYYAHPVALTEILPEQYPCCVSVGVCSCPACRCGMTPEQSLTVASVFIKTSLTNCERSISNLRLQSSINTI